MLTSHRHTLVDDSHGRVTLMPWLGASKEERERAFHGNQALAIVERWRRKGGRRGLVQVASWLAADRAGVRAMDEESLVEQIRKAVRAHRLIALPGWVEAKKRVRAPLPEPDDVPIVGLPPPRRATASDDEPTIRLVNLESPHFVPYAETVRISYAIDGPLPKAAEVRMKVKALGMGPEGQVVEDRLVPGPYKASGSVSWDGSATMGAGYISLRGSPYEVTFELTTTSGAVSVAEPARVAVTLASVRLRVDSSGVLPVPETHKPAIRTLVDDLEQSGMPGDCSGRVVMAGGIFWVNEDDEFGRTSAAEYASMAGDGIAVPLLTDIRLRSKTGGELRSPAALAGVRLLWDFAYQSDDELDHTLHYHRAADAKQGRFLSKVMSSGAAASRPKGAAAPRALGGRRGPNPTCATFWRSARDWPLKEPAVRKWAAFTPCGDQTTAAADAAIYFVTGRIAGDSHRIRATLDLAEALDNEDDDRRIDKHFRSNTVTLTNWRRVPIVADWYVGGTMEVDYRQVRGAFLPAALIVERTPGLVRTDMSEHWTRQYSKLVMQAIQERWRFLADALEPDPESWAVRFRSLEDFHRALGANGYLENARRRARNFLIARDEAEYRRRCEKKYCKIFDRIVETLPLAHGGLNVIKFGGAGLHNQEDNSNSRAGIFLPAASRGDHARAVVFQFDQAIDWETTVHEIGHALFLTHAPEHDHGVRAPDGADATAHTHDMTCVMSYATAMSFCGLCLLKLAGYEYWKVDHDGTVKA